MFQKQSSVTTLITESTRDSFAEISPIKKIVWLVSRWCEAFNSAPTLHAMENSPTLCVLFENSGFDCDEFSAEYGEVIASIEKKYPVCICGMLRDLEMGEVTAYSDDDGIWYKKSAVSGRNFDVLSCVYIKIALTTQEELRFLMLLLSDCAKNNIAFPRRFSHLLNPEEYGGEEEATHFLYLSLDSEEPFPETLSQTLSVSQLTELWAIFLREGTEVGEFDMLYEQIKQHRAPDLLRLELSLQMAVDALGIVVTNDASGFMVRGEGDRRIRMDYHSKSSAEKLFLKILFPIGRI